VNVESAFTTKSNLPVAAPAQRTNALDSLKVGCATFLSPVVLHLLGSGESRTSAPDIDGPTFRIIFLLWHSIGAAGTGQTSVADLLASMTERGGIVLTADLFICAHALSKTFLLSSLIITSSFSVTASHTLYLCVCVCIFFVNLCVIAAFVFFLLS